MDDLLQDIAAEKERLDNTLQALEKTLRRKRRTFVESAAIATCLHNAYSGMENLLKRGHQASQGFFARFRNFSQRLAGISRRAENDLSGAFGSSR